MRISWQGWASLVAFFAIAVVVCREFAGATRAVLLVTVVPGYAALTWGRTRALRSTSLWKWAPATELRRATTRGEIAPMADRSPIVVTALLDPDAFAWLDGLPRAHFPVKRKLLDAYPT